MCEPIIQTVDMTDCPAKDFNKVLAEFELERVIPLGNRLYMDLKAKEVK